MILLVKPDICLCYFQVRGQTITLEQEEAGCECVRAQSSCLCAGFYLVVRASKRRALKALLQETSITDITPGWAGVTACTWRCCGGALMCSCHNLASL